MIRLHAMVLATAFMAVALETHAQPRDVQVAVRGPQCGGTWSETLFLDVLRIELQPFADLVGDDEQSSMILVLSGDCQTQIVAQIEGRPGERIVSLADFHGTRERAVAMASARLVELWLSAPAPQVDLSAEPSASRESASLGLVLDEGATDLPDPPRAAPRVVSADAVGVTNPGLARTEDVSTAPQTTPSLTNPRRRIDAGPTLLWLPVGGVSFGLDLDLALPFRGPLFFVLGTGFTHSRRTFDEGVLRLVRLEAIAGAGVLWQRARFGIEGRLLARVGWIRLGGEPSAGRIGETQDALSVGLQLDAGIILQLDRVGFVLRAGPLLILNGLEAEDSSPGAPRSYVSFNGVSVAASVSIRVAL